MKIYGNSKNILQ